MSTPRTKKQKKPKYQPIPPSLKNDPVLEAYEMTIKEIARLEAIRDGLRPLVKK